jgi:hypothetical protein
LSNVPRCLHDFFIVSRNSGGLIRRPDGREPPPRWTASPARRMIARQP